jgi:hypothetical protein
MKFEKNKSAAIAISLLLALSIVTSALLPSTLGQLNNPAGTV